MRRRVVVMLVVLFAFLFVTAGTAMAQTATGQITGTVKDATGAVLAKAKVKVNNASTGLSRETATNEDWSGDHITKEPLLAVTRSPLIRQGTFPDESWGRAND